MLERVFFLSVIWLLLAFVLTFLTGTRIRRTDFISSLFFLLLIIGSGAVITLGTVGVQREVLLESAVALAFGIVVILWLPDWNAPGQALLLFTLGTTVLYLIYAFAITAFSPLTPVAYIFSFFLFVLETAALTLSLSYAFEVLDVLCRVRWRRRASPTTLGAYVPMVSLHVPAYNEPPELVEQTLRSLARLDYPNYEVILVDNNTPEEGVWQPLVEVCRELGFKCMHLARWPGYKAGALNFALTLTDAKADIIGVIDADYVVDPDYLRRIVPYFMDPKIAFVQTPQDYRDYKGNRFLQAAYDGYKYFFALSMPARNERNAIIFAGTMGLIRKSVLEEIGGWDEWCITEDAEASLRILNRGYTSLFVNRSFGRGLMPLDFEGMKKQRFRWAFGGVQILRKHWGKLMPWATWIDPDSQLTGAQRYFYLMSGLQWFNELLTFLFTIVVLISAFLALTGRTAFLRPSSIAFVVLPILLIGTNLLRALWGLRHALDLTWQRAIYALLLWFSLTWVVALACVQALVRLRGVFLRTPKVATNLAWLGAIQITRWETTLGAACLAAGALVLVRIPSLFTVALFALCLSQGLIYLSAPFQSILSLESKGGRAAPLPDRGRIRGSYVNESNTGFQFGMAALIMLLIALIASLWPQPTHLPDYAILQPKQILGPIVLPTPVQVPLFAPSLTPRPTRSPTLAATAAPLTSATVAPSLTPTTRPSATTVPSATPLPTLTLTPTPLPTATTVPSATPLPTATPIPPTATPLPTATPVPPTATTIPAAATATLCPSRTPTLTPLPGTTPTPTPTLNPFVTPTPIPPCG